MSGLKRVKAIVTDIEGTTTSVAFVYDVLFPYFKANITRLLDQQDNPQVKACFSEIREQLVKTTDRTIEEIDNYAVIAQLEKWLAADKKETQLKTLQGILWKSAYEEGLIKGHIFDDVASALSSWKDQNITLAVYSSGSVAAQKLLFSYSDAGDLSPLFSHYFDTTIGHKREVDSYKSITQALNVKPDEILFLSDIEAELDAAHSAGLQTIQLFRDGSQNLEASPSIKHRVVKSFTEIR